MTSGIESYRVVASVPQGLASPFPGVAGLTAAMLQDHQRPVWVTPRVAGDCEGVEGQSERPAVSCGIPAKEPFWVPDAVTTGKQESKAN